jgi:peptidoglycan/xylan/chitin deacetylase (PgdA/CDA1 family)
MYHRAQAGPYGNPPAMLDAHFAYIARHCLCVLPGEPLAGTRLNVCLVFDDAYYDFYSVVFPLLEKHNLRAVLAVPSALVREHARFSNETRTHAPGEVRDDRQFDDGYCTWSELATLAGSGRVTIAAHGATHTPLDPEGVDLEAEVAAPRLLLSTRLIQPVDSFVLPYGRFSPTVLSMIRKHYRYVFRIGGATNRGWDGPMLYRVDGDRMASPDELFVPARLARFRARYWWNRVRGR